MSVKVRFFAALREQVGTDHVLIDAADASSARQIWSRATDIPLDPHVLVAINQSYADQQATVADGDEVAFFPPVTGG